LYIRLSASHCISTALYAIIYQAINQQKRATTLAYFYILKIEAMYSYGTSAFYDLQRCDPENCTHHNLVCLIRYFTILYQLLQLKEYMNGSHTPEEREDDPRLDGKMT
jgi:hypothetical protein